MTSVNVKPEKKKAKKKKKKQEDNNNRKQHQQKTTPTDVKIFSGEGGGCLIIYFTVLSERSYAGYFDHFLRRRLAVTWSCQATG